MVTVEPTMQAMGSQLLIEYDPQPPFDSGSVGKAPADIVGAIRAVRDLHGGPRA
jgi:hypothetical protein